MTITTRCIDIPCRACGAKVGERCKGMPRGYCLARSNKASRITLEANKVAREQRKP